MTQEERWDKYMEQAGRCKHCGKPQAFTDMDAAHRVPRRKHNLSEYGKDVIDHRFNLDLTCHHPFCNDGRLVSFASQPIKAQAIIDSIRKDLEENNERK